MHKSQSHAAAPSLPPPPPPPTHTPSRWSAPCCRRAGPASGPAPRGCRAACPAGWSPRCLPAPPAPPAPAATWPSPSGRRCRQRCRPCRAPGPPWLPAPPRLRAWTHRRSRPPPCGLHSGSPRGSQRGPAGVEAGAGCTPGGYGATAVAAPDGAGEILCAGETACVPKLCGTERAAAQCGREGTSNPSYPAVGPKRVSQGCK